MWQLYFHEKVKTSLASVSSSVKQRLILTNGHLAEYHVHTTHLKYFDARKRDTDV